MPIFDYRCSKCASEFEKIVKTSDQIVSCPVCGELTNKLLSRPAGHVVYGGDLNRYTTGRYHKHTPLTNS